MWALQYYNNNNNNQESTSIEEQHSTVRWTIILSGIFWVVSMLSYIGGDTYWVYLKYVALLSVVFGLPPIAVKAYKTMRRSNCCRFDVNCMMLFAAVGALALQDYTESAAVTFLFAISEALEQRATVRARNALSAIVCLRPEYANVINPVSNGYALVVLPANSVAVGTLVSVAPGDKIPCDGVVTEGNSAVDESSLTGESRPVHKSVGQPVSGGTINAGDTRLVVRTTATSNNSAVARLIRLVEEAQSNRSDTEKLVDTFARVYTPIVVLIALGMCTFPWIDRLVYVYLPVDRQPRDGCLLDSDGSDHHRRRVSLRTDYQHTGDVRGRSGGRVTERNHCPRWSAFRTIGTSETYCVR